MRSPSIRRTSLHAAILLPALSMLSGLQPLRALAAPFCIENQALSPQCMYYDANQCRLDAQRQGAICSANPKEVRLTRGVGQYCVVTSELVSLCVYGDREPCEADARRQNGTCTNAPQIAPVGAPDPYSAIGGR